MSNLAVNYVHKLQAAPDGRPITGSEAAVLLVLAQMHDAKVGAAWPRTNILAQAAKRSPSQTNRILAQLIAKGILWRQQRFEKGGHTSNYWKFTALDGPEPDRERERNAELSAQGRQARAILTAKQKHPQLPQPPVHKNAKCDHPGRTHATTLVAPMRPRFFI